MAELVFLATDEASPVFYLPDSPTVRIRRLSDNTLVVTDGQMTVVGDGLYSYEFDPAATLEYSWIVDADPEDADQVTPGERYHFGVISGVTLARIETDIPAILVDTDTTIPASLTTIDSNVDAILVDTGTTLPATLSTIDGNVDAILVDTGTTLPATLATIDSNVDAILVDTDVTIPGLINDLNDPTAASIADAVWDEATSGHVGAATFGLAIGDILTDTGTTLPATLATIDSNVDAILVDTGTTLPATLATIDGNVDLILVDTDVTIPGLINDLNDPTAATIADAVWDEAIADHTAAGSFGLEVQSLTGAAPTTAEIADAVWDETADDHTSAGSFGDFVQNSLLTVAKFIALK